MSQSTRSRPAAASASLARLNGLLPVHALIGFLAGAIVIQLQTAGDAAGAFAIAAAIGLAGIVAAVVLAGVVPLGVAFFRPMGPAVRLSLSSVLVLVGVFLVRYAIVVAPQMQIH